MRPDPSADRLASLDQFRGATVLAMFAVNFVGGLANVPSGLKHHHTYCNFADTVMPAFLFAVGFGFRLSYVRRREKEGARAAVRHAVGRNLGLVVLGVVLYHLTGRYGRWAELTAAAADPGWFLLAAVKRGPFETLTHIGVTSLWVLPVIGAAGWVRLLWAAASAGLHVWASHAGYYAWNMTPPVGIDGGPLGFLTWTAPLVLGTLAHDGVRGKGWGLAHLLAVAAATMAAGFALSLPNKFTPPNAPDHALGWADALDGAPFTGPPAASAANYWTMSQRAGSVSYTLFAAGTAAAAFAGFVWLADRRGGRWAYLDLLGRHALAGYIVHAMVADAVKPFVPRDAPGWYVLAAGLVYLGLVTLILRHLDRHRLVLRL